MKTNPFNYPDTNSSRAGIEMLNQRFGDLKIAIIGLGGTGSYILDLMAKTPVAEIHIFDGDIFQLHNAFRSPGAVQGEKLDGPVALKKVHYYQAIYSRMHNGIIAHDLYVSKDDLPAFKNYNYVFISVDKNLTRHMLAHGLAALGISIIDTGLGVKKVEDSLVGTIRVTTSEQGKTDHLANRIGSDDDGNNQYGNNIQIADLNCLNATLAVLKWKKMVGFYQTLKQEQNMLYFISTNRLLNEDYPT